MNVINVLWDQLHVYYVQIIIRYYLVMIYKLLNNILLVILKFKNEFVLITFKKKTLFNESYYVKLYDNNLKPLSWRSFANY